MIPRVGFVYKCGHVAELILRVRKPIAPNLRKAGDLWVLASPVLGWSKDYEHEFLWGEVSGLARTLLTGADLAKYDKRRLEL